MEKNNSASSFEVTIYHLSFFSQGGVVVVVLRACRSTISFATNFSSLFVLSTDKKLSEFK